MMNVSAWGALLGLALAVFLIMKKTTPAYALIAGAFIGGFAGSLNIEFVVKEMIAGVQGIVQGIGVNDGGRHDRFGNVCGCGKGRRNFRHTGSRHD
jgi:hypothetical protein